MTQTALGTAKAFLGGAIALAEPSFKTDLSESSLPVRPPLNMFVQKDREKVPDRALAPQLATCKVVHLGQAHRVEGKPTPAFTTRVVESQMKIAAYLHENKGSAIVLEGLTEHLTPKLFKEIAESKAENMIAVAKTIFPKGLPSDASKLTDLQKEFIYEIGAPRTMWYLGEVKEIRRAIGPEASKEIDAKIKALGKEKYGENWGLMVTHDKALQNLVFAARENAALKEVAELQFEGRKSVVVIFGQAHDFEKRKADYPDFTFKKVSTTSSDPLAGKRSENGEYDDGPGSIRDIELGISNKALEPFKDNVSSALVIYGNINKEDPKVLAFVVKEEKKILEHLKGKKLQIEAWEWQHLATPELLREGLPFLKANSVGTSSFPMKAFEKIIGADPELKRAGEKWIKGNAK